MKNSFLYYLLITVSIMACQPDDDGGAIGGPEPPRPRGPQAQLDDQFLNSFIDTHAFNDLEIENALQDTLSHNDIEIIRLFDDQGNKIELTEVQRTQFSGKSLRESKGFNTLSTNDFDVNNNLYYIVIREGAGREVSISDDMFTGSESIVIGTPGVMEIQAPVVLDTVSFQNSNTSFFWRNGHRPNPTATAFTSPIITQPRGFTRIASKFRTASPINPGKPCEIGFTIPTGENLILNRDFGIGIMIIPSGLFFYDNLNPETNSRIEPDLDQYSNVLIKFSIANNVYNDTDNDGVLDIDESVNTDRDTDNDDFPDFIDVDDDNDGIATAAELITMEDGNPNVDSDCDQVLTNDTTFIAVDSNEDGIPDYLDPNIREIRTVL